MNSPSSSWSMTVVRMQGMQSLRVDTRWRPEVSISFNDETPSHKFVLGVDGRNPNLKTLVSIPASSRTRAPSSRLSIEVFCRAPTAKKQGKSTPLCFALVPLSDVLRKHDSNSSRHQRTLEHEVALIRVNAPRGKTAMVAQKRETPKLVLRFYAPDESPLAPQVSSSSTFPRPTATSEDTPEACDPSRRLTPPADQRSDQESDTVVPTDHEAGPFSSPELSNVKAPAFKAARAASLRKRSVDTSESTVASTSRAGPIPHDVALQPERHHDAGSEASSGRQDDREPPSPRTWLQLAESCVNYVGPYDELQEAEAQSDDRRMEVILARLVTEWQSVSQMLIGLAAVNTTVIGLVKGSTAFTIDDFSLGAVTIGAIAAGLGMAMDAWFFFLFSGADVTKFKKLAKDVYGTYFFFCLVCRLPTIHMFVSVLALGLFLLCTAWVHSPTTALVIFCVFGVFVGSQDNSDKFATASESHTINFAAVTCYAGSR
ncbi:hypothetical protein V8D89_007971 [Ganoderma adspersum]